MSESKNSMFFDEINNKNNIKKENNEIQNNNDMKEKMTNMNIINSNIIQGYSSKSENDLYSNLSEKDLYGTIQNFSKRSTPKKVVNNIKKVDVVYKGDENQNQLSSLHNGEAVYRNYFSNNNKLQNTNYKSSNKFTNQTHGVFFSRSSEKYKRSKCKR